MTTKWNLMLATKDEIAAEHPCTRRFFQSGFELDPRNHDDNTLGLASLQQIIRLNLHTGEIENVC